MTISGQFLMISIMVGSGIYLGMAEEVYRRLSLIWLRVRFITYLFECMFWLIQAMVLFYVLYRINGGELRLYIVFALLLGFSMYVMFLQRFFRMILEFVWRMISYLLRMIRYILLTPLFFFLRIVIKLIYALLRIGKKGLSLLLFPIYKLILTIIPPKISHYIFQSVRFCSTMKRKLINSLQKLLYK